MFAVWFESKFSSPDDKNATLYVWARFAMNFLMRPLGAAEPLVQGFATGGEHARLGR